MVGMNKGEQRDIKVTFPTDYQAEHLAGKEAIFKVTVHEISFEEIPELDDDFVQDTSEFNTVAEFEANIREELEKRAKENSKFAYENAAVQKAVDNAKVEIHKDIVEEEVDMQIKRFEQQLSMYGTSLKDYIDYAGITMEDIRNDYRKGAEANLKAQYVIGAIVDEEKIEPTEANYIEAVRRSNPGPDWDDEKVKAELEKNRSRYVSSAIFEAVVELIVSNSVAVEPKHDEHDEHCDCGCEHDENK